MFASSPGEFARSNLADCAKVRWTVRAARISPSLVARILSNLIELGPNRSCVIRAHFSLTQPSGSLNCICKFVLVRCCIAHCGDLRDIDTSHAETEATLPATTRRRFMAETPPRQINYFLGGLITLRLIASCANCCLAQLASNRAEAKMAASEIRMAAN